MPARAALNVVYALLVDGLDSKERQEMDAKIYGWGEINERANRVLLDQRDEGGDEG